MITLIDADFSKRIVMLHYSKEDEEILVLDELATHYDIATGITTTDCIALILNTFDGSYRIGEITCDENDCVDCSSLVGRDVKTALEMLRNSDS